MTFRSRAFDHLGNVGSQLADLQGYASLAHELIQNADDVGNAEFIRFDVRKEALIVDNGGVFRSCGSLDADDCPWLEDPEIGRRCDFHRFAWIGAGDKRREENTTGAFGLGFLAVYQITDAPEVISAGQHWILNEAAKESERIYMCQGCERCNLVDLPSTRFILPWATDSESPMRRGLRAQATESDVQEKLLASLRDLLPGATIFLRSLDRVLLAADGETTLDVQRIRDGQAVLVQTGTEKAQVWHRLDGDFAEVGAALKEKYPQKIEPKRSTRVTIAFGEPDTKGLLFAWLPTQEVSGLPCHIHADFFPTRDRKHLLWENDYRSEWNRAALLAVAQTIAANLETLKPILGHIGVWALFQSAKALAHDSSHEFKVFWTEMLPYVKTSASVFTRAEEWLVPSAATIVDADYDDGLPALEALGIQRIHSDLDSFRTLLADRADGPGVRIFRLSLLNDRLGALNIASGTPVKDCPRVFRDEKLRRPLLELIELLLGGAQPAAKEDRNRLHELPLLVGTDDKLWAAADAFRADEATVALLTRIDVDLPLLPLAPDLPRVYGLVRELSAADVIDALQNDERMSDDSGAIFDTDRIALLEWFAGRRSEFDTNPFLGPKLAALPLFPAGQGFRPLDTLSLPGEFQDHLGVAEVVSVEQIRGTIPFLEFLGAKTLSFPEYVKRHVPKAFENPDLSVAVKRELVALLAERQGELQDHADCGFALKALELVECRDGSFVLPADAYFSSPLLKLLADTQVHVAVLDPKRGQSLQHLYQWLGVARGPRLRDVRSAISKITAAAPTPETRKTVQAIFEYLGEGAAEDGLAREIADLTSVAWLPAIEYAMWCKPSQLAAVFNQDLFASQALFIDVDRDVQNRTTPFLRSLGVQIAPTVGQVVKHLRRCAEENAAVKENLYERLSEEKWSQDPAIETLVGTRCIYLEGIGYVYPRQVFWSDPGFGKYRFVLSDRLRGCARFLDRVGVRMSPEPVDAVDVILDISGDASVRTQALDQQVGAIVDRCWSILADGYRAGQVRDEDIVRLREQPVVPDANRILNRPEYLFFEDRPNLALHFRETLGSNVIPLTDRTSAVLEAAGVRRLSKHIAVEVLECHEREESHRLRTRCQGRRDQLHRVAVAAGFESLDGAEWTHLQDMAFESSTNVLVRYACDALGRVRYSQPQSPRAIFLDQERALIGELTSTNDFYWPDVARELALAIYPDLEPGRISGVVLQALSGETPPEADAVLDSLGVPRLAVAAAPVAVAAEPIEGIGTPAGDNPPPFVPPTWPAAPPSGSPNPGSGTVSSRPNRTSKPRSRFVTYVVPENAEADPSRDPAANQANRETEQAGVRRVKWFEEAEERIVTVMPPNHPGYDIESRIEEGGDVERYIEVKSQSGAWDVDGVGLTVTEFNKARELRDRYWLYVVEWATSEQPEIYRIQDPAGKANWFFFDRGWSQVAT